MDIKLVSNGLAANTGKLLRWAGWARDAACAIERIIAVDCREYGLAWQTLMMAKAVADTD